MKYKLFSTQGSHYVLKKILNQNSRFEWILCSEAFRTRKEAILKMEELQYVQEV